MEPNNQNYNNSQEYTQGYNRPPYGQQQGYTTPPPYPPTSGNGLFDEGPEGKSRGIAALLAIFVGSLGLHYFYLGKTTGGIVYLLISLFTCGSIAALLGLIQGVKMLGMTNEDFRRHYVLNPSSMPF